MRWVRSINFDGQVNSQKALTAACSGCRLRRCSHRRIKAQKCKGARSSVHRLGPQLDTRDAFVDLSRGPAGCVRSIRCQSRQVLSDLSGSHVSFVRLQPTFSQIRQVLAENHRRKMGGNQPHGFVKHTILYSLNSLQKETSPARSLSKMWCRHEVKMRIIYEIASQIPRDPWRVKQWAVKTRKLSCHNYTCVNSGLSSTEILRYSVHSVKVATVCENHSVDKGVGFNKRTSVSFKHQKFTFFCDQQRIQL